MVKELPEPWKPTGGRRFHDCNQATVVNWNQGVYMLRNDVWKGTSYGPIPYNYTCIGNQCIDPAMQSMFEVVYYRESDNLMILYGCYEMTEMVQTLLQDSMPLII